MHRLTSYSLALAAIILFVLSPQTDATFFFTAIILSVLVAAASFLLNWSTFDSILAIIVTGSVILGFAGWSLAFALFFFFASSSILTSMNNPKFAGSASNMKSSARRDGFQIWSNGFWAVLLVLLWVMFDSEAFLIAAFASLAVATADTWATEIGIRKAKSTVDILSRKEVEPGIDGGVSRRGFVAALAGSVLIALFTIGVDFSSSSFFIILTVSAAGFAGAVVDSLLGSIYLSKQMKIPFFGTSLVKAANGKNNLVNWLATGSGALLALIIHTIF